MRRGGALMGGHNCRILFIIIESVAWQCLDVGTMCRA